MPLDAEVQVRTLVKLSRCAELWHIPANTKVALVCFPRLLYPLCRPSEL